MLDPEGRATWEPILAKHAAPGMGNPDDEQPCTSGTPSQEQIEHDTRSHGQRCHDAFVAVGRNALMSGELGQHHGLPVTVIVSPPCRSWRARPGMRSPAVAVWCRCGI